MQNFIPSKGITMIYWKTYAKTWLVDRLLYLQGKLLWTTLLFRSRQTGPSPLSALMLVSFILSLSVQQCQLVCTRDGKYTWNLANLTASKQDDMLWKHSDVIISTSQTTVWSGKFLHYGYTKNAYSVDGFWGHCCTVFEANGCYCYHYFPFREARPSLTEKENQRGFSKRELDE